MDELLDEMEMLKARLIVAGVAWRMMRIAFFRALHHEPNTSEIYSRSCELLAKAEGVI